MAEQQNKPYIERVNDERKHLEGLLKDRIHFHLLFAAVFLAGFSSMENAVLRRAALCAITLISFLIALAVLRTFLLVRLALKEIRSDPTTPYGRYYHRVWFPINANDILLLVPIVLTVCFFIATVFYWHRSAGVSAIDDSQRTAGATYQIDDHSDHRNMTDAKPPVSSQQSTGKTHQANRR